MPDNQPFHLYTDLSSWWRLLSPPDGDYVQESAFIRKTLIDACAHPPQTLLEFGCGGGNNALYLKKRFDMTLVDIAPGMLEQSKEINPECEHVEGDMRTVRLKRTFDAVFIHDAISYMTTEQDLKRAFVTAFTHCKRRGAVLILPDYTKEIFVPRTETGGEDGADGRSLRYLEWTIDPDPTDSTYRMDMVYMLRERDGSVRVEHDEHIHGLFPEATWLRLLEEVGFKASAIPEPFARVAFLAVKP